MARFSGGVGASATSSQELGLKIAFHGTPDDHMGPILEMDGITEETTLRDVWHFFETRTGFPRGACRLIIPNISGGVSIVQINANSRETFYGYLLAKHGREIESFTDGVIPIYFRKNVFGLFGHGYSKKTLFMDSAEVEDRTDIPDGLSEFSGAVNLICPLKMDIIRMVPVKINDRYYDFFAFGRYLVGRRDEFQVSHDKSIRVDPFRIELPIELKAAIELPADPNFNNFHIILQLQKFIVLEEYEDKLADLIQAFSNQPVEPAGTPPVDVTTEIVPPSAFDPHPAHPSQGQGGFTAVSVGEGAPTPAQPDPTIGLRGEILLVVGKFEEMQGTRRGLFSVTTNPARTGQITELRTLAGDATATSETIRESLIRIAATARSASWFGRSKLADFIQYDILDHAELFPVLSAVAARGL